MLELNECREEKVKGKLGESSGPAANDGSGKVPWSKANCFAGFPAGLTAKLRRGMERRTGREEWMLLIHGGLGGRAVNLS